MHLKSLTIRGFKSFAGATNFVFEPGVTAIVGPNGSGKSNVVDALAWVMGEQGAKTLRGGKMEDVIFAGSASKAPLGRAEVTLTIDNSDGALPIEYSEVTISRTLFRNGGSEYAINGTSCRLLDVQELLSDSGLGREMHVIVGQGQLDAVLHASNEDRRGFIEEAAGILKHRRRKEKTVRKLEAMEANFTRLNDLAGELRRQLKPLGQQADISRQAQLIASVVRDAKARLLADEVVTLKQTLQGFSRTEQERSSERMILSERLEQALLKKQRLEQLQQSEAVEKVRRTVFALEQADQKLRNLSAMAQQRIALLEGVADTPSAGAGVTDEMLEALGAEITQLELDIAQAESAAGAAAARVSAHNAQLQSMDEQLAAQTALISQHELESSRLAGEIQTAQSRLSTITAQREREQASLMEATQRRESLRAALEELELNQRAGESDAQLQESYQQSQAETDEVSAELEQIREKLHGLERRRDALAARSSALSMALESRDGSQALIEGSAGKLQRVAEQIQVTAGFESAIGAALGSLADALIAETPDEAYAALASAAESDLGRVEVVIANPEYRRAGSQFSAGDGVWPASELVKAPEGVLVMLDAVLVAEDIAAARAAFRTFNSDAPLTVVTKAGEVLSRSVLRGGSPSKQSRIELVAERDQALEELTAVSTEIEQVQTVQQNSRALLAELKQRTAERLEQLRQYDAELAAQADELSQARVKLEAAVAECDRLETGQEETAAALSRAEAAVADAKLAAEKFSSVPKIILDSGSRDALAEELETLRQAELQQRIALETVRERFRSKTTSLKELQRQAEADRQAVIAARQRAQQRQRQRSAAQGVLTQLPAVIELAAESLAEARQELARLEAERSSQNTELQQLRQEESTLREQLTGLTENVHSLELQMYEKKLQLSAVLEKAAEELGFTEDILLGEYNPEQAIPLDDMSRELFGADLKLAAKGVSTETESAVAEGAADGTAEGAAEDSEDAEADEAAEATVEDAEGAQSAAPLQEEPHDTMPFNRAQQQKRLQFAERKLSQLGRVNPLALEEFAALEQRHTFLTEQLDDLIKTRKDLQTIIGDLDETMQGIFLSAFEDTKAAFAEVFPVLFPGGTGHIELSDPENLLTTGIEVSVKPAGKKIERLSLLSGGERSLAAVAFLIAIFKSRPSPFYILDEVEAALDDANLGRLLTIFQDLRENSQLIIITHQKRTMEIADALYGVSMRQDGVSAVVSQKINREGDQHGE